jgi:hypothetical protein
MRNRHEKARELNGCMPCTQTRDTSADDYTHDELRHSRYVITLGVNTRCGSYWDDDSCT